MERFLHYKVTDFIEDESFVRWVEKNPGAEDFNWESWLSDNPDKEKVVKKASSFILNLRFKNEEIEEGVEDRLWATINSEIDSSKAINNSANTNRKRFTYRRLIIGAVAAAMVGLVFFMNIFSSPYDSIETVDLGDMKSIDLPDGSLVQINSLSEIKFDKDSWHENRKVVLEGEAFFKVEKGSSFIVETKNGEVKVLGTSFNVFSRKDRLLVSCETGKVLVTSKSISKELLPNQAIKIVNNQSNFIEENNIVENRVTWLNGIYKYENEDLEFVVSELERQLNLQIKLPSDFKKKKFSGSFNKTNKEEALSEVLWPLGLKYVIEGRNVNVSIE